MADLYTPSSRGKTYRTPGKGDGGTLRQSDLSRVIPRQISTGTTRGTQTVGYGNAKIDGTNNRITIGTPDGGTIGFGAIPGSSTNEFGFFSTDSTGKLIMKIVDGTWYVNDPDADINVMQSGILPDGQIGWAVASEGNNVADGFS